MRARYAAVAVLIVAGAATVAGCARRPLGHGNAALVFVSPGCPIANRYLPELERLAARFAGRVDFKLVYPDASDEEVRAHRGSFGLTIAAERDPTHKLVSWAHASVTPEAALFRDGALVWHGRIDDRYADVAHERPAATTHELEDALAALADGRALPPAQPAVGCAIEPR
jgi:hypothetical protein